MAYVYHDRANKGLSLLFFDPEISQEGNADYDLILEILESFSRSLITRRIPFSRLPTVKAKPNVTKGFISICPPGGYWPPK